MSHRQPLIGAVRAGLLRFAPKKVWHMHIYRLNRREFRSWRSRDTRGELKQHVFTRHGISQLRSPSGRILGTARAPESSGHVPIERTQARGAHHAVSPAECLCREWQKPAGKEKEHHPICAHKAHWEAQQARSPDLLRERAVRQAPAAPALAVSGSPNAETEGDAIADTERRPEVIVVVPTPATVPTPAPNDCVCKDWAGGSTERHHSLCQFRERWEKENGQPNPMLIELESGEVAREASEEEVVASKKKAEEDGVGAIELSDGKLYYVRLP